MSVHFPNVKAILWFDEIKVEAQAGGATIDWRFTGDQQIQSGLGIYIQTPAQSNGQVYWKQLSDFTSSGLATTCSGPTGSGTAPITAAAATYSANVSVSSPPPPVQTGTTTSENAATAANGAQSGTLTQEQASNLASLIGRRLFSLP